jgi:hypothetical protein
VEIASRKVAAGQYAKIITHNPSLVLPLPLLVLYLIFRASSPFPLDVPLNFSTKSNYQVGTLL